MGAGVVLRYGSIELGRDLIPANVGPSVAFVPLARPLPVGTEVAVEVGDGSARATVIRVVESVKGRDAEAGVWIRLGDMDEAVSAAWSPLVTAEDAEIPEGIVMLDSPKSTEGEDAEHARKGDSSHPPIDDGRATQVMNAVEVAEALAEQVADSQNEPSAPAQDSPEEAPKKRRRRRRRR